MSKGGHVGVMRLGRIELGTCKRDGDERIRERIIEIEMVVRVEEKK